MDVKYWNQCSWDEPWTGIRRRPQPLEWCPEEWVEHNKGVQDKPSISTLVRRLRDSEDGPRNAQAADQRA